MSTSTHSQSRECPVCGVTGPDAHSFRSHCSPDCFYRAKGQGVLDHLRHDHRFCASCFAQLKEVARPPEDAPDVAIGYQYARPAARKGLRTLDAPEGTAYDRTAWATVCDSCPNTDHRHYEPHFGGEDVRNRAQNLIATLDALYLEDKLEHYPDRETLVSSIYDSDEQQLRWAFAIGKAIYDSS